MELPTWYLEHRARRIGEPESRLLWRLLGLEPASITGPDPDAKILTAINLLSISKSKEVRRYAIDQLLLAGDPSRKHMRKILDDPHHPWFLYRNALYVLGMIGKGNIDGEPALKFLTAPEQQLRREAFQTYTRLTGKRPHGKSLQDR